MTDLQIELERACEALPIFPLPRAVLMPGASLPLHVFEPRYRELVDAALARDRLFGIATLQPGYQVDYEGRPAVWPEVGIGRIVAQQKLDDGRSNLVLQSVARGLIIKEQAPERAYRTVQVELLHDQPPRSAGVYGRLRQLVRQVGHYSVEARAEAQRLLQLEGSELIDALARKLLDRPDDQRRYLREDAIEVRSTLIEGALAEVLAAGMSGAGEA